MDKEGGIGRKSMLRQVGEFDADQKKFMMSQIISATYNNIVSGVLMTGFLLYIGVPGAAVGVMLSIPLLANVLQIPFAKMWSYFGDVKKAIIRMVFFTRLMILSIILIPIFIPEGNNSLRVLSVCVVLSAAYIFASSSGIRLNYWMVNSVNASVQGTFFAFRDRVVVLVTTIIAFASSWLIDLLKVSKQEYLGFAAVFLAAAFITMADYRVIGKVAYKSRGEEREGITWKQSILVLLEDKRFCLFLTYMFALNFSINIANPYFNAYMVNELHLDFTRIMLLTSIQALVQILVSTVWGKAVNYLSWEKILLFTSAGLGLQFLVWPFVTVQSMGLIVVIFITSGLMATGLVTSQFMVPYAYVNPSKAVIYLSLSTGITACGGFMGSLMGSGMITSLRQVSVPILGFELKAMQINMLVSGSMILGTVLYSRIALRDRQ